MTVLFSLHEEAPGMPFIHPKGMIVWNKLIEYWRELHDAANYIEIKTPTMMMTVSNPARASQVMRSASRSLTVRPLG